MAAASLTMEEAPAREPLAFGVVSLLALAVFINYVDRGNLATAAPLMKDQLRLTNTQIGVLISAFFWTYTPGQVLVGWLAERINAYRTLALGVAIWSVSTLLSGLAGGFAALLLLRLFLGLGESAALPCASKLFARHLPSERLGAANGLVSTGLALGPGFGALAGGLLMAHLGWRPVFMLFGAVSLLWLIPWRRATAAASKAADGADDPPAPGFGRILRRRSLWGAAFGHFASNYVFYFVVSWLPLYLVKSRGLSMSEMAGVGGAVFALHAASCQATGWLSDRWMAAGASDTRVRKTFCVVAHLGYGGCMLACALGGPAVSIAALLVGGLFSGFITPTIFAIGQTLGGPRGGGKWVSVQNCVGNLAGVVGPIVTGYVVDRTGQFVWAFAIAAVIAVGGAASWGLIVGRVEAVDWEAA